MKLHFVIIPIVIYKCEFETKGMRWPVFRLLCSGCDTEVIYGSDVHIRLRDRYYFISSFIT